MQNRVQGLIGRLPLALISALAAVSAPATSGAQEPAIERGRVLFKHCYACHTAYRSERGDYGLSLWGVVGRRASAVRGYDYSPAMRAQGRAGLIWSESALDRYLADPIGAIPGTSMPFPGFKDARDRADLIEFLKKAEAAPPRRRR